MLNERQLRSRCKLFDLNKFILQMQNKLASGICNPRIAFRPKCKPPRLRVKYPRRISLGTKRSPGESKAFPCIFPRQQRQRLPARERKKWECHDFRMEEGEDLTEPTDAFIAFNRLSISVGLQFSVRTESTRREGKGGGWKTGFHRYQLFAR